MFLHSSLLTVPSWSTRAVGSEWSEETILLSQWHSVVCTVYEWDSDIYVLNLNSHSAFDSCLSAHKCFPARFIGTLPEQLPAPVVRQDHQQRRGWDVWP